MERLFSRFLIAVSALPALFNSGCVSQKPVEHKQVSLVLVHQSNRYGAVTPCGCQANPIGGIDREANALAMIRAEGKPVFYVDAGNTFVPNDRKVGTDLYADRAGAILEMLSAMETDVLAPGPTDYEMGAEQLLNLALKTRIPFISTNVLDRDGKPFFQRYVIVEKQGVKVAFVSLTPKEKILDPRLKAEDPIESAERVAREIGGQVDLIVALSQLGSAQDERLASNSRFHVIVGADPKVGNDRGFTTKEAKTVLIDTSVRGQQLGRMDLELVLPFEGLYSDSNLAEDRSLLETFEASAKADPGNSEFAERLRGFKAAGLFAPLPGGSKFEHRQIPLDEPNFGKKNRITQMMQSEAKRLRKKALSE